jgi:NitT/TauT family transport system substrate-binding protein
MRYSRRELLTATAAGAVVAALPVAPRRARAQSTVRIGTAVLGAYTLSASVIVALEKGFFKAQGLAAEFVPFRGGPDLVKAVISWDVLLGLTGSTDIIVFREAGSPIRMTATQADGNDFVLVGGPEGGTLADLKGKAIGVTRIGATTWVFARMAAKGQGWDPERDVKIVGLGGLDAQLAALARKEIAAFVWGDFGAVTEAQGRTKLLLRLDSLTPKWIASIQYSSEEQITKNPDAIRQATRALFQALRFMRQSPQEAAAVIGPKLGWTPGAVKAAHAACAPLFSADGRIQPESLRAMQDALVEAGSVKRRVPLEEHYTHDFTPVRL